MKFAEQISKATCSDMHKLVELQRTIDKVVSNQIERETKVQCYVNGKKRKKKKPREQDNAEKAINETKEDK